eukprot:TRINITY_DN5753_c0_g1_i1.p1 TRINITY_DN5753_c0_g1~~TRINITY_DN5753_c0_g1_i1.p1  ORF type:complete len:433 (+),score=105.83 TRINITY_DN5753_c0_g1_i1:44-1342(+)
MDVSVHITTLSQHVEVTVGEHETLAGLKHKVAEQLGIEQESIEVLHMEDVSDEDEVAAYLPEGVQVRMKEEFRTQMLQKKGIQLTYTGMRSCIDKGLSEYLWLMKEAGFDVHAPPPYWFHITKHAVFRRSLPAVKVLHDMGFSLKECDAKGCTLLHHAALLGFVDIIEYLSALHPELVNFPDENGAAPLHNAVNSGTMRAEVFDTQLKVIDMLMKHKAEIGMADGAGKTPLHFAVWSFPRTEKLIQHGACVNAKDTEGRTSLHYAKADDIVALLVSKGADVDAQDERGQTPLHLAVQRNREAAKALLTAHADYMIRDEDGRTALHMTVASDGAHIARECGDAINVRDKEGNTPLHHQTDPDTIKALVELGADVNAVDINNQTPMFCKKVKVRELFVSFGASPTHRDVYNLTPDRKVSQAELIRRRSEMLCKR